VSYLVAIHPDGTEVELRGEGLRLAYARFMEWCRRNPWSPLTETDDGSIHPQLMAYESTADIVGYGGAAGGGKTDLACGLAITRHRKIMVLRRVGTELQGILDRLEELLGGTEGYNGQKKVWKRLRFDGVRQQIEFASLPNSGDERGYQGRPHDLLVFDEAANFLEHQVRFLLGWLRSTVKGQRKKALLCFNPPTSAEGQWIFEFFAAWLDDTHPNPAKFGELRWYATDPRGKDVEVPDGRTFVWERDGDRYTGQRLYDYDPKAYRGTDRTKIITPLSRTFIPSKVSDNPFLANTGYMAMLQGLPEPLRSQMLNGDFKAGMVDDVWQVIPTAWVRLANIRWQQWVDAHPGQKPGPMDSLGVDVARGGRDENVFARRHGVWFDVPVAVPGVETPTGQEVATHTMLNRRDDAVIHMDVIGVGGSPFDIINGQIKAQIVGVDVRNKTPAMDKTGHLTFFNLRSALWWAFREWLDPTANTGAMLPPHSRLTADLTAPKWKVSGRTIQVEAKEEIEERIGRSPDYGTAYVLGLIETPKLSIVRGARTGEARGEYDPYATMHREG
jgi:hypothetical protein